MCTGRQTTANLHTDTTTKSQKKHFSDRLRSENQIVGTVGEKVQDII